LKAIENFESLKMSRCASIFFMMKYCFGLHAFLVVADAVRNAMYKRLVSYLDRCTIDVTMYFVVRRRKGSY